MLGSSLPSVPGPARLPSGLRVRGARVGQGDELARIELCRREHVMRDGDRMRPWILARDEWGFDMRALYRAGLPKWLPQEE